MNIEEYLEYSGFGESALMRRPKSKIKEEEFSLEAYMESYKDLLCGNYILENTILKTQLEALKMSGHGESELKEKLKSGAEKVKKFLIELYDKCIRFFTETVRYFFSAEKRYRRVAVKWKAIMGKKLPLKTNLKRMEFTMPFVNTGLNLMSGYNVKKNGQTKGWLARKGYLKKGDKKISGRYNDAESVFYSNLDDIEYVDEDVIESFVEAFEATNDAESANERIEGIKSFIEKEFDLNNEELGPYKWQDYTVKVVEDFLKGETKNKEDLDERVEDMIFYLRDLLRYAEEKAKVDNFTIKTKVTKAFALQYNKNVLHSLLAIGDFQFKMGMGMRGINKLIRTITEKKRKLIKDFKEGKEHSEEDKTLYKRDRRALTYVSLLAKVLKEINEFSFKWRIQIGNKAYENILSILGSESSSK